MPITNNMSKESIARHIVLFFLAIAHVACLSTALCLNPWGQDQQSKDICTGRSPSVDVDPQFSYPRAKANVLRESHVPEERIALEHKADLPLLNRHFSGVFICCSVWERRASSGCEHARRNALAWISAERKAHACCSAEGMQESHRQSISCLLWAPQGLR